MGEIVKILPQVFLSKPIRRPTRRDFLGASGALLCAHTLQQRTGAETEGNGPYNAMGERVGEVRATSALVHTRLTAHRTRNSLGFTFPFYTHSLDLAERDALRLPQELTVDDAEGACPGQSGRVRLHYGKRDSLSGARVTPWAEVGATTNYTKTFQLENLESSTTYYYAAEMGGAEGRPTRRGAIGRFRTAPLDQVWEPLRFFAITGQDYSCRDHPDGYESYQAMIERGGDFLVSTGDNVYYDIDLPIARSVKIGRYHWHRIYSQPLVVELFRQMSGYWLKDDHDVFQDDSWPSREGDRVAPMTYRDLAPVIQEQMPIGEQPYRRFRWGKGVEMWLLEGRDFRSPNTMADGPDKTLWGPEQEQWLKRTLLESDAQFRVLLSPTAIVGPGGGPDRETFKMPEGGADSHADGGFAHEGREFRHWAFVNHLTNLVIVNGDRHWQYHSIDPETGLHEFCCGALTDRHSTNFPRNEKYHRFVRSLGGFLEVALEGRTNSAQLAFRFRDVQGRQVYEALLEP